MPDLKTLPLNQARAEFSDLFDRALAGEPCRVTRYGKDAVVIVSEADWNQRKNAAPSLGHLLAQFAEAGVLTEDIADRPWKDRPLGKDFD